MNCLDFALYCNDGKLDIETDGDTWHSDKDRIPQDNLRDNDIETNGWSLLRFNTKTLHEQMNDYCLPTIIQKVNQLGGPAERRIIPGILQINPAAAVQLSLFDDQK